MSYHGRRGPYYVEFGRRLRAARLAKGLTCEFLAGAIGQTRQQIANLEAGGSRILLHDAMILAAVLGKRVTDLAPQAKKPRMVRVMQRVVRVEWKYRREARR